MVAAEVLTIEVALELVAELNTRVKVRQPEELEVFDTLRLSVEVLTEVLPEVLTDVAADVMVAAEAATDVAARQEED